MVAILNSKHGRPGVTGAKENELQLRFIPERGLYIFARFQNRWYSQRLSDFNAESAASLEEQIKLDTDIYTRLDDSCFFLKSHTDALTAYNAIKKMPDNGDMYLQQDTNPPKLYVRITDLIYRKLKEDNDVWDTVDYTSYASTPKIKAITATSDSELAVSHATKIEAGTHGSLYVRADYEDVVDDLDAGTPSVTIAKSWTDDVSVNLDTSSSQAAGSSSTNYKRTSSSGATSYDSNAVNTSITLTPILTSCTEDNTLGTQVPITTSSTYIIHFLGMQMWGKIAAPAQTADDEDFIDGTGYLESPTNSTNSGDYGSGIGIKTFPSGATTYHDNLPNVASRVNIAVTNGFYPAIAIPDAADDIVDIWDEQNNNIYNKDDNTDGFTITTRDYHGPNSETTTMKIWRSNNVALGDDVITWKIGELPVIE